MQEYRTVEGLRTQVLEWHAVPISAPPTRAMLIDDETDAEYQIEPIGIDDERVCDVVISEPQVFNGHEIRTAYCMLNLGVRVDPYLPRQAQEAHATLSVVA